MKAQKRALSTALIIVFFLLGISTAIAETPRYALVVGNSAYSGEAALKNPVNDATDMAAALKQVGWNVTLVTDADRRTFNRAIVNFRDNLAAVSGSVALFYYAGHGMQSSGRNYLIPVKTDFETLDDIEADAINVQSVTDAMEQANTSVSLVILDACRDNPFAKKFSRSLGGNRGLTLVQSKGGFSGSAVMFATSPGDVALDGSGRNGIFTCALLKYINSDLKIEDLFKKVTSEVREQSAGTQNPWINASLTSDFYFTSDEIRANRAEEAEKAHASAKQTRLLGKIRIESSTNGKVFIGKDLLGDVEPDMPLMADNLPTGQQEFRFESVGKPDAIKTVSVTDNAYVTIIFGLEKGTSIQQSATGNRDILASLWIHKAEGQVGKVDVTLFSANSNESKIFSDIDKYPVKIEPGEYTAKARLAGDSNDTFEKSYQVSEGGKLIIELPSLSPSQQYKIAILNTELTSLKKDLESAAQLQERMHKIGWGSLIGGVVLVGVGSGFLVDMLASMSKYKSATITSTAEDAGTRATIDSKVMTILYSLGAPALVISLPLIKASPVSRKTKAIQADEALIQELGVQK